MKFPLVNFRKVYYSVLQYPFCGKCADTLEGAILPYTSTHYALAHSEKEALAGAWSLVSRCHMFTGKLYTELAVSEYIQVHAAVERPEALLCAQVVGALWCFILWW